MACIDDDEALHAMARLSRTQKSDPARRRHSPLFVSINRRLRRKLLQELAKSHGPLAEEARNELKKRLSQPALSGRESSLERSRSAEKNLTRVLHPIKMERCACVS